jgi:hypothetical protein
VRQLRTSNMRAVDVGIHKLSLVALPMRTINIHSREESAHWAQSTRKLANPVNMKVVYACSHLEKAQQECMICSHTHMHHNLLWAWGKEVGGVGVYPATWVCGRSPREVA